MDTPTSARSFGLRLIAWSLGLFGILRLPWIAAHLLLPATRLEAAAGVRLLGASSLPIDVTLACSGADAVALCLAAILAYPARWRMRSAGMAGGLAGILVLNTIRIGTLGRAAASPRWFNVLHVYVWPIVLTLAIAAYVFTWMGLADGARLPVDRATPRAPASRRFVILTLVFLAVFSVASPLYLESALVLSVAGFVARTAAATLHVAGVSAEASGNVLWTARGGFQVTQECISTPLIPVYLAAVCTFVAGRRRLIMALLSAVPLFAALGIVRLLVVALPLVSPVFFVHAFYQLLLGGVIVCLAASWRHRGRAAVAHAVAGVVCGVLFAVVAGPLYTRAVSAWAAVPARDPQGALAFLPQFQASLYLALSIAAFLAAGWWRFALGFALLGLSQAAGLRAVQMLTARSGLTLSVPEVRAWAVVAPVLIFVAVLNSVRTPR